MLKFLRRSSKNVQYLKARIKKLGHKHLIVSLRKGPKLQNESTLKHTGRVVLVCPVYTHKEMKNRLGSMGRLKNCFILGSNKILLLSSTSAPIFRNPEEKKVFTYKNNTYPIFEIPEKGFFFFKIEIYFEHV